MLDQKQVSVAEHAMQEDSMNQVVTCKPKDGRCMCKHLQTDWHDSANAPVMSKLEHDIVASTTNALTRSNSL